MVSVKFKCPECEKEFHIDELDYSEKLREYFCPTDTCGTNYFVIKNKEEA